MNEAASHLANRKELQRATEKERFLKTERCVWVGGGVGSQGTQNKRKVYFRQDKGGLSGELSH